MASIVSRNVAAGDTASPTDWSNLRADLLDSTTGHDHDGTAGKQVDHDDLVHQAGGYSPTYDHENIDDHIDASQLAHGLSGANEYIAGIVGNYVFIPFTYTLVSGLDSNTSTVEITLPVTMANTSYFVYITPARSGVGTNYYMDCYVYTKSTTSVTVNMRSAGSNEIDAGGMYLNILIVGLRSY